jgi:hypothetical protein
MCCRGGAGRLWRWPVQPCRAGMGRRADGSRSGGPAFADRQRLADKCARGPAARDPDQRAAGPRSGGSALPAAPGQLLRSARVGRRVWLRGKLAVGEKDLALDAAGAQIGGTFRWAPAEQVAGRVSLDGAAAGELDDDWTSAYGFWPADGRLSVKAFTYDRVGGVHPATVDQRLNWIRGQYPAAAQDAETSSESS